MTDARTQEPTNILPHNVTTFILRMPHHNLLIILLCLSTHLSFLPVRSSAHCLARPQPYLISTQTYIHLNKLPPEYITSTACSRHSSTHLSLLTATLLLCGDVQPNVRPTHPANLLICTIDNTQSSPEAKSRYTKAKHVRNFYKHWCDVYKWLVYDNEKKSAFCTTCRQY